MAKATIQEWIRTLTPLAILAIGALVGAVRFEGRLNTAIKALEDECARSKAEDKGFREAQHQLQLTVTKIETHAEHTRAAVGHTRAAVGRVESMQTDFIEWLRHKKIPDWE